MKNKYHNSVTKCKYNYNYNNDPFNLYDKDKSKDCKDKSKDCKDCYHSPNVIYIQAVYIIALFLWIFLILWLELWSDYVIVMLILIIPVFVYLFNFINLTELNREIEEEMFQGNFLYFGFIVAIILINWDTPIANDDKTQFFKIVITAFILLMLSIVDLWISGDGMTVIKHIKTSLHTASLTLLALALYLYYTYHANNLATTNGFLKT